MRFDCDLLLFLIRFQNDFYKYPKVFNLKLYIHLKKKIKSIIAQMLGFKMINFIFGKLFSNIRRI
jgi:hypothetical protein